MYAVIVGSFLLQASARLSGYGPEPPNDHDMLNSGAALVRTLA